MSKVKFNRVVKLFGSVTALRELDLEIQEGEFLSLLGPSGCGKTTTLRLVAGFIDPSSGTIKIGDKDVTHLPPQFRDIGMVFQHYALFPHMTVGENIGFGLKQRRFGKSHIAARVKELLELVRLPDVKDRYPNELSGGQAQRVAVARAVAYPPNVLLMDEPLGALDLKLREMMQSELRRIQQELKITTIYVTHDQTEAINMSDRIAVMNDGLIDQLGSAEEIYNRPANKHVAKFVGQINLLEDAVVKLNDAFLVVDTPFGKLRAPKLNHVAVRDIVTLAVRPERLRIIANMEGGCHLNTLTGTIVERSFSGNLIRIEVDIGNEHRVVVESPPDETFGEQGAAVTLAWDPEHSVVLLK